MQADEIIRRTKINQIKSKQAIRRSKSLVKMTMRVIEREKNASEPQAEDMRRDPRPLEIVRADARPLRENSRLALEQSKAARNRHIAFRNRFSVTGRRAKPPESNAA